MLYYLHFIKNVCIFCPSGVIRTRTPRCVTVVSSTAVCCRCRSHRHCPRSGRAGLRNLSRHTSQGCDSCVAACATHLLQVLGCAPAAAGHRSGGITGWSPGGRGPASGGGRWSRSREWASRGQAVDSQKSGNLVTEKYIIQQVRFEHYVIPITWFSKLSKQRFLNYTILALAWFFSDIFPRNLNIK